MYITDLAKVLAKDYGHEDVKFNFVGIRPGEKLHEEMVSLEESMRSVEFDKYYMITDDIINNNAWSFSSDSTVIDDVQELKNFLIEKGVIK